MQEPPRTRPRRRHVLIVLIVAGLLAVAGITAAVLWPEDDPVAAGPAPVLPLAGHHVCADHVTIELRTDAEMTRIADVVHSDPRARKVYTETRDEAFQRFRELFKDQPELLAGARPEALPSSVTVTGNGAVDLRAWAGELRTEFPEATRVEPFIRADALPGMIARYGTEGLTPCPAGGEWD